MSFVKASLNRMLNHLTDRDRIGLVGFATGVREIMAPAMMTAENKEKFRQAVDVLTPQSTTNLSGGLFRGVEQMTGATKGALNRIMLFTDGLANCGVCNAEELSSALIGSLKNHSVANITVSCFGYGNDVDTEFLEALARIGKGNYYHIDKPDNAPRAFGKELGGLLSTVAQNIRIRLTPKPDVKLHEVLNDFTVSPDGDSTIIEIEDIFSEEKKHIVVHLGVPAISEAVAARPFKVCDINIAYVDIVGDGQQSEDLKAKINVAKNGNVQDKPNSDVEEQIAVLKAAQAIQQATLLADSGDYSGAQQVMFCAAEAVRDTQAFAAGSELLHGLAQETHMYANSVSEAGSYGRSKRTIKSARRTYGRARSSGGAKSMFDTKSVGDMADNFGKGITDVNPDIVQMGATDDSSQQVHYTGYEPNAVFSPAPALEDSLKKKEEPEKKSLHKIRTKRSF